MLQQFKWPVVLGLVTGTGVALAAIRILRKALYGINNLDPLSYVGALGVLMMIVAMPALLDIVHRPDRPKPAHGQKPRNRPHKRRCVWKALLFPSTVVSNRADSGIALVA